MDDSNSDLTQILLQPETVTEVTDDTRSDIENNQIQKPLLRKNAKLPVRHLAMIGAEISHIESLDYEINESDLFKQDWRNGTKVEVLQYVFYKWMLAFLVGLLTGLVAVVINLAVENIAGYKLLTVSHFIENRRYGIGLIILTGANFILTLIASSLCASFAPAAAGPGIPEIKAYLNGIDTPNMYDATTLFVKLIGTIAAVPAGLDLGKEGPLVHIGTCIASLLGQGGLFKGKYHLNWPWNRFMNNDRDQRDLITYGASSGVCAAFRSPVGGILFSVEEVATWWRSALLWRTFFSTAVVVVVLRWFTEYCEGGRCGLFNGGLIMFDASDVEVHYDFSDIVPVVLIGLIGGVLGSLYNCVLIKVIRLYSLINEKGKLAKVILSLTVSVFTSLTMYALPFLVTCTKCDPSTKTLCPTSGRTGNFKRFNCADGYYNDLASLLFSTNDDAVRNIFSTNTPTEFHPISLLLFFTPYCILGLITFAIAVPSGIFLPIILIGSAYGRLIAILFNMSKIDHGLYAILGAASLMAGSMRMTVSVCAIFLELTNNLLLLPITMLVLLIAKCVGDSFNPSIYESILELKGLPFLDAKPEPWMTWITVGELANVKPALVTLTGITKVAQILDVLKNTTHNGFPVINDNDSGVTELRGVMLRTHLIIVLKKKWFLEKPRKTEEWEVKERFTFIELESKETDVDQIKISDRELGMYVDLNPFVNKTPYTVAEDMSVAKAMMLFRQLALRHLLIVPKYRVSDVFPVTGILTRQDLMAHNILCVFPHLAKFKGHEKTG